MTSMALAATLFGPEDLRMIERPLDHPQIFRAEQRCGQSHRCHFASPIYFGNQSVRSGM